MSFPTSYIKTEGSQVTRVADSASISGSNFSEWYRQDEGTVVFDAAGFTGNFPRIWSISDGTTNNQIEAFKTSSLAKFDDPVSFTSNSGDGFGTLDSNVSYTPAAVSFSRNDFVSSSEGVIDDDGLTGVMPRVDRLYLGANREGEVEEGVGTIKRLTYYPKRLPNAVLQALTKD